VSEVDPTPWGQAAGSTKGAAAHRELCPACQTDVRQAEPAADPPPAHGRS
jgi:hypothetical protein